MATWVEGWILGTRKYVLMCHWYVATWPEALSSCACRGVLNGRAKRKSKAEMQD